MSEDELGTILDPGYLAGLDQRSTADVRRLRAECEAAEEGVSYARRLLQGRLDILRAELHSRDEAGDGEASHLLTDLAGILSHDQPSMSDPLRARATRLRVPDSAEYHEEQLDHIVSESQLARLDSLEVAELAGIIDRLAEYEQELSALRHSLFVRLDTLRNELADRYKDGRADVSQILAHQEPQS